MKKFKQLYLARHGIAISGGSLIKDYDRTLAPKGISGSYRAAKQLAVNLNAPQLIISSPASRAIHTALIFARTFGCPFENIRVIKDLYDRMDEMNLGVIKNIDDCIDSAMLVGHNPSMAYMAKHFLDSQINIFPTSGVVYMEFEADSWDEVIKLKPVTQFINFSPE